MKLISLLINPKSFFSLLKDKGYGLRFAIFIIISIALSYLLMLVMGAPTEIKVERNYIIIFTLLFLGFSMTFLIVLSLILKGAWIQLCYKVLGVKTNYFRIFSFLAYTTIPVFFHNLAAVLLARTQLVDYKMVRNFKVYHLRIDLGQLFSNSIQRDSFLFHSLQRIGPFEIWRMLLEVIAISVLGQVSYKKSVLIIIIFWGVSLFPYFFSK